MSLPPGFKIDNQPNKYSVPTDFVFDEPEIEQPSYAAPKDFILDEVIESASSFKQGQPPTMLERGKEAVTDFFRRDPGLGPLTEEDYTAFEPAGVSVSGESTVEPITPEIPTLDMEERLPSVEPIDPTLAMAGLTPEEAAIGRPISTITGEPVPTPEEEAAGGKAAMAVIPYGFASAVRGMVPGALERAVMDPLTQAIVGKEYVSPIDEALKIGKYLPEAGQMAIGAPAHMVGAYQPLKLSFAAANAMMKAARLPLDLILRTGPVMDRIAGHVARGGIAGAVYGGLEAGTPKGMAEDAAFFGALEGGLGAVGGIFKKLFSSNWYRNLEVPERGLVVQSAEDLLNAGHSEGTILRTLSDPVERGRLFEEAARKRIVPEEPAAPHLSETQRDLAKEVIREKMAERPPSPAIPEEPIPTVSPMEIVPGIPPAAPAPMAELPPLEPIPEKIEKPKLFKGKNVDAYVSKSAKMPDMWQVTSFDKKRIPLSDSQWSSYDDAITAAKREVGIIIPEEEAAFDELLKMKPRKKRIEPEEFIVEHKPILSTRGLPWKEEGNALKALRSREDVSPTTHKVVKVKKGYGIVPFADKRARVIAEAKPEKVKGKTLIAFVRAMGGIRDATLPGEIRALSPKETGVVGLTTNVPDKGLGFDEMADAAVEHGWLPEGLEDKPGAFSEILRDDIFAQKEKKPRVERLAGIAEKAEREERWKEFERAEDAELEYFAKHPDEEIDADLDQWQREAVAEIRRRNEADRARKIEKDIASKVEKENPDLEGLKKDEGFPEYIEGWDEKDLLDEEALAELEAWRAGEEVVEKPEAEISPVAPNMPKFPKGDFDNETKALNQYLVEHDPKKGQIPAKKPYLKTRDEEFAEIAGDVDTQTSNIADGVEDVRQAIWIGEKLGYHPDDIARYLEQNYVEGVPDGGKIIPQIEKPKKPAEVPISPELKELHEHKARTLGFEKAGGSFVEGYLKKLAKVAEKTDMPAATAAYEALSEYKKGNIEQASLEAEKILGKLHKAEVALKVEKEPVAIEKPKPKEPIAEVPTKEPWEMGREELFSEEAKDASKAKIFYRSSTAGTELGINLRGNGIFLGSHIGLVSTFGKLGEPSTIHVARIKYKKPHYMDWLEIENYGGKGLAKLIPKLEKQGYDAIVENNKDLPEEDYQTPWQVAVFDKSQITQIGKIENPQGRQTYVPNLKKKIHKELIEQALKSGKLTPEKYAELHEKDYGSLAEFMPKVVEKPKPEVVPKVEKEPVLREPETKYLIAEFTEKYRQSELDLAFGGKKKADEAIESVAKEVDKVSRRGMPDRVAREPAKSKVAEEMRKKKYVDLTGKKLTTGNESQEIAELFQVYRSPKIEILHAIYTSKDGVILGHNAITSGDIGAVGPKDGARYVYQMQSVAKRLGATKVHILHNHPTGNPTMSQNDVIFANRLHTKPTPEKNSLGDLMGEFIVIDHGKFTWVSHYFKSGETYVDEGTYKVTPSTGEWMTKKGRRLTGPEATAAFGQSLAFDESKACFVYVDGGNNVVGWSTHDKDILKKENLREIVKQQAKGHDATKTVILVHDIKDVKRVVTWAKPGLESWLLDAQDAKGYSLREALPLSFERRGRREPTKPAWGLFEPEAPYERKRPWLTKSQKERRAKKKAIKEKQLKIENAKEAKEQIHGMIRDRRQNLNLAAYETNLFINDIEQQTTKTQREIIPFIIEKTDIPESLNRPDLEKAYKKDKDNLASIALQVKQHFDAGWLKMKENIPDMSAEQVENYVTHIWDLDKGQKRIVTNWFITQNRFLKKRYIETLKEGIEELGLTPKVLDISEIIRIHDGVANRAIENVKFVEGLKGLKYEGMPLIERADKAPQNWVYFDHPALRRGLVIPGKLKTGEKVSPELSSLLEEMGVAIGRRISPVAFGKPVGKAGEYISGEPPEVRFQRFMSSRTVAHEIGHHLDEVLGLGYKFLNNYASELYAINRERIESRVGKKGKYGEAYARSTEEQIAEFFATLFTDASKAYGIAPNATADALNRLRQDEVLSKLIDFDFEKQAKNLIEEQLNTLIKLPVKVHPDLEKPLKVIFESRIDHPVIQAYEVANGVLKKTNLSLSLFHHGALGETGIAIMGLRKVLNIYFNPVKIYKAMAQGKFDIFEKEPVAKRWIGAGLQVGATADVPVNMIQNKLNNLARKTKNVPLINKTTEFVRTFNEVWDKALWNYLHDTLKLYACESLGTKIDPSKDMVKQEQEITQFVNDTFGGQNWDTLMVSPKSLQIMTWSLLSADWTTSTVRQALSPTGIGKVHKETAGLRRKLGAHFWIKAGLYFGVGINMLNYTFREWDEKEHPEYYKGMGKRTFLDKTMVGNTMGHKTHLFVGRYEDGTERYIRWGKQFRELPELFFDDTGFSPISATFKKVGGKLAPMIQLTSKITTGTSPSGFRDDDIYGKKGWDRVYGMGRVLIKSPLPFATRALFQEDKKFHLTDLAMPSSKGMTRWKSINLFKHAIIKKDDQLLKETYQFTLMNNLPAYTLFSTALTILKAESTKEFNEGIKTIENIEKSLDKIDNPKDLIRLKNKLKRILKENADRKLGMDLLDQAIIDIKKYEIIENK